MLDDVFLSGPQVMLGSIVWSAQQWVVPAIAMFTVATVILLLSYRLSYRVTVKYIAVPLKLVAFLLLAVCLVEPLWNGTHVVPGANLFLVVADDSAGLQVRDRAATETRGQQLKADLVDVESKWQIRLKQDFQTRNYAFNSRLRSIEGFDELEFNGGASAIHNSLTSLAARFKNRPVAGILFFTDGNATDWGPDAVLPEDLPPIYPVVIGSDASPRDLALSQVSVSQTSFDDSPVTIRAEVTASEYRGKDIIVRLLDSDGQLVEESEQLARSDDKPLAYQFDIRPSAVGVTVYKIQVAARGEFGQFEPDSESKEATLNNNSQAVVVDRGQGPFRILYVSGRPNWEYKFLHRAIDDDDHIDLVAIIRVARREPRFSFLGRGQRANPLFRNFEEGSKEGEDVQDYDQPVLVRLNTRDDAELRDGFPKSAEQLYQYDGLILDDVESGFFTQDQMHMIRRYVTERGAGFLMLGGQESFRQGGYDRTPIEEMLPVYLDNAPASKSGEQLRFELSREGWIQPWVRLRRNEADEKTRVSKMPPFRTVNRSRGVKPGASVLATVSDGNSTFPALVAQRFGLGRSSALLIGDMWRWGMKHDPKDRDLEKAWRQTLRWLVSDVPQRIDLQIEDDPSSSGHVVQIQTQVRDPEFRPVDNASVLLTVTRPDGSNIEIEAEPSNQQAGSYVGAVSTRWNGTYRVTANVKTAEEETPSIVETAWVSNPLVEEFRNLRPNRTLLEQIAKQTGGELIELDGVDSVVDGLSTRTAPVQEQFMTPLWHRGWVFLIALACLVLEWGLRRWKGLP